MALAPGQAQQTKQAKAQQPVNSRLWHGLE